MKTILVLLTAVLASSLPAEDFSSTNTLNLHRFWNAVERRDGPVTVMAFGDSLQIAWRSVATRLFPRLAGALGSAGIAFTQQVDNSALGQAGGPYIEHGPDTNWWNFHTSLCAGGYAYWYNENDPTGSVEADHAGIYYIATPDGGTFTVSVSSQGAPWTNVMTVNASNAIPEGRFVRTNFAKGLYRVRTDANSGANLILGHELGLSDSNGLRTVFMQCNGLNLGPFLAVPPRVQGPIFSNLNPDLIIWHMKEYGEDDQDAMTLSNRLETLEAFWRTHTPNADVVYIGTPYAYSQASAVSADQNRIVRALAVRHERAYVDGMTPMIDYLTMVNNGYLGDFIHPSTKYYQWLADTVWDQLLFSALRRDRSIKIRPLPEGFCVTGLRMTNTIQHLLSSTNLFDWATVGSVESDAQSCVFTNPPGTFFRWELLPTN